MNLEHVKESYPEYETMTREQLLEELNNELHDIGVMVHEVSLVYDHATGGRISKPMTCHEQVIAAIDDFYQEHEEQMAIPEGYYFRDDLDGGRLIKKP